MTPRQRWAVQFAERWLHPIGVASAALVGATSAVLVLAALYACAGQSADQDVVTAAKQADVTAYAAEEQSCVALASSRAEADVCISGVQARWCGPGGQLQLLGACGDSGIVPPEVVAQQAAVAARINAAIAAMHDAGADR